MHSFIYLDLFIDNGQKEETESSKIKILIDFLLLNCFILTQITLKSWQFN